MIQAGGGPVRSGVIALSRPNHPLRLVGIFAASVAFFAVVAAAAVALAYIVRTQRGGPVSQVAGVSVDPKQSELNLPDGLVAWRRVQDADEFKQLAGFKPFVPQTLPEGTQPNPSLAVSFPDDNGTRVGRIGYSPRADYDANGITGPMVVIQEAKGTPGTGIDGELKRLTSGDGRALAATVACKKQGLVLDVQLYFGPPPAPGEPFITPSMTDVAQKFVDGVKAQCGG